MQLLEILYYMDLENVLPRTEDSMKMNPKELLNWTTNIADTSTKYSLYFLFFTGLQKYMLITK